MDECSRVRDDDRRQLHDSYTSVLFGEWKVETSDKLDARVNELLHAYPEEAICRILAEAEAASFSILLTYDDRFQRNLRSVSSSVSPERPSSFWVALAIPRGAKPDKIPH